MSWESSSATSPPPPPPTDHEYKGFITHLGIKAQSLGLPAALSSPAWLTRAVRHVATQKNPKMIESFIKKYGVNYARANKCNTSNSLASCASKYDTLDDFFTRRVRGITVDPSARVVSPADCKAVLFDDLPSSGVWVKGRRWGIARLLKQTSHDPVSAIGIFRLRPVDYHRFHSPVSGKVFDIRPIRGKYLSVDPSVVKSRNVLTENARTVVSLDTSFGTVYFVAVGAAGVGTITMSVAVGDTVRAGDELGMFSFGGSTVVVTLPLGVRWDTPTTEEVRLTVGQGLVR